MRQAGRNTSLALIVFEASISGIAEGRSSYNLKENPWNTLNYIYKYEVNYEQCDFMKGLEIIGAVAKLQ